MEARQLECRTTREQTKVYTSNTVLTTGRGEERTHATGVHVFLRVRSLARLRSTRARMQTANILVMWV